MKTIIAICLCVASIGAFVEEKSIQKPSGRIVGGSVAREDQFPYQVAIYFDTPDGTFFCGGALIDRRWVLTSGYCVYHATVFTLHLGSNSLVDNDPNRVTIGASYSVAHPDYNPQTLANNIGLIRIDVNITLNAHIQTVPLASSSLGSQVPVTVSGWGASGDWDGVVNDLNYVGLRTISNADCRAIYGGTAILDEMVCAIGQTNEGTCNGDSGSPLATNDGNGHSVHVGIVSFVSTTGCETNHPSGYTRTATYLTWINNVIRT